MGYRLADIKLYACSFLAVLTVICTEINHFQGSIYCVTNTNFAN